MTSSCTGLRVTNKTSFGLLYAVDHQDIIEVVAGIDEEGWVALQSDRTLLSFTGEDFEVVTDGVIDISELAGVELEFECLLGSIGNG
ncbi:MAG: hypothetical protein ACREA0_32375 [bacterium]